jgi:hypothetical protein
MRSKEHEDPKYAVRYKLGAGEMKITSFFILPHRYTLPSYELLNFKEGRSARPCDIRLDEPSYLRLMERRHLPPQIFEPTAATKASGPRNRNQ